MGKTQGPVSLDSPPGAATSSSRRIDVSPVAPPPCPLPARGKSEERRGVCADILATTEREVKLASPTTKRGRAPGMHRGPLLLLALRGSSAGRAWRCGDR